MNITSTALGGAKGNFNCIPGFRILSRLLFVIFILLYGSIVSTCCAIERAYSYELEMSSDNRVCRHMQEVYNSKFREPWNQQTFPIVRLEDVFTRLPGVEFNEKFVLEMIYSKFPTSPEFDAIKWRESRFISGTQPEIATNMRRGPLLVAETDIDNDGVPDTVLKTSFMSGYTTWGGWDGHDEGSERLHILPGGTILLNRTPTLQDLMFGEGNQNKACFIEGRQVRLFILDGVTYLSKYEDVWVQSGDVSSGQYQYPRDEYIHIMKYIRGGEFINPVEYVEPEMRSICRLRMIAEP